jgi:rfaE bifunctional protein kinase chain/domain
LNTELQHILDSFNGRYVLIVGDVMIDRYLNGSVNRISPEAPVPVLLQENQDDRLGGAANVALNIQALGGVPLLCSVLGNDNEAEVLKALLEQKQLYTAGLIQAQRFTTVKTRVMARNQQLLRIDRETDEDIDSLTEQALIQQVYAILDTFEVQAIVFQDYNKGVLTESVIGAIMLQAQQRGIPTVVDPKKQRFFDYQRCTLFKPNLREINDALVGQKIQANSPDLNRAVELLYAQLGQASTLITLGDKGMFLHDGTQAHIIPAQTRAIADVCGAGDTVVSVMALGLAANASLLHTAQLANLAGGLVCEQAGVVAVDKKLMYKELD